MQHQTTAAPAATRPGGGELSPFARTCLAHCPDPEMLELIGRSFLVTAAELRGVIGRGGHA